MRVYGLDAPKSVHPRVGGEHDPIPLGLYGGRGSSPRGRGTHLLPRFWVADVRFIPAWAGNTALVSVVSLMMSVHPRVGGEHRSHIAALRTNCGSSPRGRGTLFRLKNISWSFRFIPAWAGNTPHPMPQPLPQPVHPRVGGEHNAICFSCSSIVGSSPRGRGTRTCTLTVMLPLRFIPAWAGNTATIKPCGIPASVHPRVGGEHSPWLILLLLQFGSSPRGRGTLTTLIFSGTIYRFIPAWAGNTSSSHPRITVLCGSSPRGRGTPKLHKDKCIQVRFIPAWAGNT